MNSQAITETTGHLLVQICRAHRNKAQELLARVGLHPGQEFLLMNLWLEDGPRQSELADQLCVQPATLTRMIDRMEKAGYIRRQPDPDDQRVSRVYLTDNGRALQKEIEAVWMTLETISFANLTTDERVLLRRLMLQVYQNLT